MYACIQKESKRWPVKTLCNVLGVHRSDYYAWLSRKESKRKKRDKALTELIKDEFKEGRGCYGAPRVHQGLKLRGEKVSRKRVARLMKENGLRARCARKFKATTNSNHTLPIAPNLLHRNFCVGAPNRVWVGDITYVWTEEGWIYLAVVIDLYSRRVVGWSMSHRMKSQLVRDAFDMAVRLRRPQPGLVFHSDRGSQYASKAFRHMLMHIGARQSMSRKGDCWDNAVAESFFASLKKEIIGTRTLPTRNHARSLIFNYIEIFYNRKRRHTTLGGISPFNFERCNHCSLAVAFV